MIYRGAAVAIGAFADNEGAAAFAAAARAAAFRSMDRHAGVCDFSFGAIATVDAGDRHFDDGAAPVFAQASGRSSKRYCRKACHWPPPPRHWRSMVKESACRS